MDHTASPSARMTAQDQLEDEEEEEPEPEEGEEEEPLDPEEVVGGVPAKEDKVYCVDLISRVLRGYKSCCRCDRCSSARHASAGGTPAGLDVVVESAGAASRWGRLQGCQITIRRIVETVSRYKQTQETTRMWSRDISSCRAATPCSTVTSESTGGRSSPGGGGAAPHPDGTQEEKQTFNTP